MGHWMRQLQATLYVYSSLALVALGSFDPTRWVLPLNPELWQTPRQSWGPFWIQLLYPVMYRARCTRSRMMHKIILLCFLPCLRSPVALPPQLLHCGAIKLVVTPVQPTSSRTISHRIPASFPTAEKKRGKRETGLKEQGGLLSLWGVASLSLLFHGGVGLAHVEGHVRAPAKSRKLGVHDSGGVSYLLFARGPCISSPVEGYIVACTTCYERGFGVPSHRFLCSLLQFYDLELHHLTPYVYPTYCDLHDPVQVLHGD
jgi:hypothetical protein